MRTLLKSKFKRIKDMDMDFIGTFSSKSLPFSFNDVSLLFEQSSNVSDNLENISTDLIPIYFATHVIQTLIDLFSLIMLTVDHLHRIV